MTRKAKVGAKGRAGTAGKAGARRRTGGGWWAGLCCGALLLVSPATSLVLAALLLPGLVCLVVAGKRYSTARAMLLFGLAGSVSTLSRLLGTGATVAAALELMRTPGPVITAWTAAGAGWLVTETTAAGIALTWLVRDGIRKRSIDRSIEAAEEEWGPLP